MRVHVLLACAMIANAACGDDDDTTDTDTTDTSDTSDTSDTADTTDTSDTADTTDTTDTADTTDTDIDVIDNAWGFPIRTPTTRAIPCTGGPGGDTTLDALDADWLCTLDDGTTQGVVYVQSTPVDCEVTLSEQPVFGAGVGWLWRDGQALVSVTEASYDWGGNHHNDSLELRLGDKRYRFYHSSFGFGFRKCQPMDCLQVRDAAGTLIEDGCTSDRTLPIVCRSVSAEGTWDALTDTFAKCNGDPTR